MLPFDILTDSSSILRCKSSLVKEINKNILDVIDIMVETMHLNYVVGLTACQINIPLRIIVLDLTKIEPKEEKFYPLIMINPKIYKFSDEKIESMESCKSSSYSNVVKVRSAHIKVKYTDCNNQQQEIEADGLLACAIQHEANHLDGISMTDDLLGDYLIQ